MNLHTNSGPIDVFISYARKDAAAVRVIEALKRNGLNVWWDRKLLAGDVVDRVIEQRLQEALVVAVLWSPHAMASRWVQDEADAGASKLVHALLEACTPPMGFRRIQCEDLSGWNGDDSDPRWQAFVKAIRRKRDERLRLTGGTGIVRELPAPTHSQRLAKAWLLLALVLAAAGAAAWLWLRQPAAFSLQVATVAAPTPGLPFQDCSACPVMMALPGGTFAMGSPAAETGRDPDETQRKVKVPAFALGTTEVTNRQWNTCIADGGCPERAADAVGSADHPAVNISWDDARGYVAWLARRTGVQYRLPREDEWEYAARAGSAAPYSFGSDPAAFCDYGNGADETLALSRAGYVVFPCNDGAQLAAPVRQYRPNKFGLFDMQGNVSEWLADCWGVDAPVTLPADACRDRAIRGGHWAMAPDKQRVANRMKEDRDTRREHLGLRVARTLQPQAGQPE